MPCYLYVAHLWLAVAAAIFLGYRRKENGDVTQWRLFGAGPSFDAYLYPWLIGGALVVAAFFAYLFVRSLSKAKLEPQ